MLDLNATISTRTSHLHILPLRIRNIVNRIYETLDRLQNTNMFNPKGSINILGLDANGHVGFTKDLDTDFWNPGGSESIGAFDHEK